MTFQMPQSELEILKDVVKDAVYDIVYSSHKTLDEKSSNYWGEMKTEIALMKQSQSRQEKVQELILTQVNKTNGRVTVLEGYKKLLVGGGIVFSAVVLPALGWMIVQELNLANVVSAHIGQSVQK